MAKKTKEVTLLPLNEYDKIHVSFSGGKDSVACVLFILEELRKLGMTEDEIKEKVELWHQDVDGGPDAPRLMDWPCTHSYCVAFAAEFGLRLRFQWRNGGFLREFERQNEHVQGVTYEDDDGKMVNLPASGRGSKSTRGLFPQTSADLSVRWCSSTLKIDVYSRAINNVKSLRSAKVLLVTGERAEESAARSKYLIAEAHKSHGKRRTVHQYRAVHGWHENKVWEIIERNGVIPHPAYRLGYGRVSCRHCIFADKHQWATNRELDPSGFTILTTMEVDSGKTIKQGESIVQQANRGESMVQPDDTEIVALANSECYPQDKIRIGEGEKWELPRGAYKRCGGPI